MKRQNESIRYIPRRLPNGQTILVAIMKFGPLFNQSDKRHPSTLKTA